MKCILQSLAILMMMSCSFATLAQQAAYGVADAPPPTIKQQTEDTSTFRAVQNLAVSGFNIHQFIGANFSYPSQVFDDTNFVAVKVLVEFIVEKDASISSISIKKFTNLGRAPLLPNTEKLLKMEVIRVMRKMPRWQSPAYQEGKTVRSYYNLPINLKYE